MNLDRTFCISHCANASKCDRVYSQRIWKAAEKIGKQNISIAKLHENCDQYKEPKDNG